MRAYEFINEGKNTKKLRKSSRQSLPNLETWPHLDNNNHPYLAYRFGVAMAGSPDEDMDRNGPIGSSFTTIGYTDADREITKKAGKIMKVSSKNLTGDGSEELNFINTKSTVPDRKTLKKCRLQNY